MNSIVLADVVAGGRCDSSAAIKATLTFGRRRPSAVTTDINISAAVFDIVVSDIVHAGRVNKTRRHGELVDFSRVTTVARATCIAVDNHLGIETNRGCSRQIVQNVESVSDC